MTVPADPGPGGAFGRHLSEVALLHADRTAVAQGRRTLTWREFHAQSLDLARELRGRGVGPGYRVGILSPNRPEYLIALYALFLLDAVPVNVNYRYRASELAPLLRDCAAGGLIHADELSGVVDEALPDLPANLVRARFRSDGRWTFDTALWQPVSGAGPAGADEWLLYTGGTTGLPKAVVGSQQERLDVLRAIALGNLGWTGVVSATVSAIFDFRREHGLDPVYLTPAPLMHGTGLYCALIGLIVGGTVVLTESASFDAAELAGVIGSRRVTELHVVGEAMTLPLVEVLEAAATAGHPYDVSSLRRVQSVGAVWTSGTKHRLLVHADAELVDMIAATEGGPFAVSLSSRSAPPDPVAAFVLGRGARVVREDGSTVRPGSGEVGVLAVPTASGACYLGDASRTAATFRDIDGVRYVAPGDLATLSSDGTVELLGRGSSVINTGGEKVYADEVENLLRTHPAVHDVVVVGVPDARFGQIVGAVFVPVDGAIALADLAAYVSASHSGYKKPRVALAVAEIRRLASGKADLAWARAELAQVHAVAAPVPRPEARSV